MLIPLAICAAVVGAATALILRGNQTKSRWGVHLHTINCPHCSHEQPTLRKPTNIQQAAWGGWTCEECGTQMDKWGRQLAPPAQLPPQAA